MSKLTRTKLIACLMVIFAAGGISGAVLEWGASKQAAARPPTVARLCSQYRKELNSRLKLSAEQERKIEPLLQQRAAELQAIHKGTAAAVHQLIEKSNAEIARELTSEQRDRFDAFNHERQEFWERREQREKRHKDNVP